MRALRPALVIDESAVSKTVIRSPQRQQPCLASAAPECPGHRWTSAVSQFRKAVIDLVKLRARKRVAKLFKAVGQRAAAGVLAEYQVGVAGAYRRRRHNLVGQRIGQHAVLVNTRFMRKSIGSDHRLVGRSAKADALC